MRLVQHAKATGIDPNVVLARYAAERFLYRLSRSRYADRFVLKGALLMLVWLGETIRPTRDADLLGKIVTAKLESFHSRSIRVHVQGGGKCRCEEADRTHGDSSGAWYCEGSRRLHRCANEAQRFDRVSFNLYGIRSLHDLVDLLRHDHDPKVSKITVQCQVL